MMSDMVDNNVNETFNGWIVRARSKHIIQMLEDIRSALRYRQYVKLEMIKKVKEKICPNIRKKIEKAMHSSRYCSPSLGIDGTFEVTRVISRDKFIVNHMSRQCSCRMWDITGIPCVHGLSAILFLRHDPFDYVHEVFSVDVYKAAYSYGLPAINGQRMWPKATGYPVQPPLIRKMPGRPKKKRVRDRDEVGRGDSTKLRRSGLVMTCSNCGGTGHNKKTCKEAEIPKQPKVTGKRGRPKKAVPQDQPVHRAKDAEQTKALKKAVARERALAKKGIGRFVAEGSGNTYLHGSLTSGIYSAPATRSASQPRMPTQESRAN